MRLNRFLAAAGIGSRRHCDELIASGRVTINGKTCTDFSAQPSEARPRQGEWQTCSCCAITDHHVAQARRIRFDPERSARARYYF